MAKYRITSLPKAQKGDAGKWVQDEGGAWMQMADDYVETKPTTPLITGYGKKPTSKKIASPPIPPIYGKFHDGETLNRVAQNYIGGSDLETASDDTMARLAQNAEKKEVVAQHYLYKMQIIKTLHEV
jgi:hypothetical protein